MFRYSVQDSSVIISVLEEPFIDNGMVTACVYNGVMYCMCLCVCLSMYNSLSVSLCLSVCVFAQAYNSIHVIL